MIETFEKYNNIDPYGEEEWDEPKLYYWKVKIIDKVGYYFLNYKKLSKILGKDKHEGEYYNELSSLTPFKNQGISKWKDYFLLSYNAKKIRIFDWGAPGQEYFYRAKGYEYLGELENWIKNNYKNAIQTFEQSNNIDLTVKKSGDT